MTQVKKTALFDQHRHAGAQMVVYAGWEMPLHYGSQIKEHHAVRSDVGIFDVSHMTLTRIAGKEARLYLRTILANDVGKLERSGTALYSCLLNEAGGVVDDLIVYRLEEDDFLVVSNAGTRERVRQWFTQAAVSHDVRIAPQDDHAIIAVQGPRSRPVLERIFPSVADDIAGLARFCFFRYQNSFIACTGYTGEDGFEIIVPKGEAVAFWKRLITAGAQPAGLGARDSLRLEAGYNLYGVDMDEETTPLESGLEWSIAWQPADRTFVGRAALESLKRTGVKKKRTGILLEGKGVFRNQQNVFLDDRQVGIITSGGFSPTLGRAIALARVEHSVTGQVHVEIRGRRHLAKVVNPPFILEQDQDTI